MRLRRLVREAAVGSLSAALVGACSGARADGPEVVSDIDDPRLPHVACVGDSITAGDGTSLWSTAYPARLQALLGPEYAVENDGRFGATMLRSGALPYWTSAEMERSTAWVSGGGDVVIQLGTNDSNDDNWAEKSEFLADCIALVNHYRATSPATRVWIAVPPPVSPAACCSMHANLEQEVIPLLVRCAETTNATSIDVHGQLADHPEWFDDGVHPNAAGLAKIARAVHAALSNRPTVDLVVSTTPSPPPTVSLRLTARPTPAYGTTEHVRFFEHEHEIGDLRAPPWELVVDGLTAGVHSFAASIEETGGRTAWSSTVAVDLVAPAQGAPRAHEPSPFSASECAGALACFRVATTPRPSRMSGAAIAARVVTPWPSCTYASVAAISGCK